MTLREIQAVLRHRWLSITATALAGLAVAGALTRLTPPEYTATARVYFATHAPRAEAEAIDPLPADGAFADASLPPNVFLITTSDLQTYIQVMSSPLVADAVRADLALPGDVPFSISAATPSNTPVLDVTATAASPQVAAAVANAAGPQLAAIAGDFSLLLASAGQTVESNAIAPALPSAAPSSPHVGLNLAIGLGLGLLVGVAIAVGRHRLDTRIRDEDDLRTVTDLPVLASIPEDKRHRLTMESNPYGAGAEAVRRLRTNLRFIDLATTSRSVVVTSALPQEGKTTTAINLAIAMADAGSRVLLVDADLRNPSVARALGMAETDGVTSVLLGDAHLAEAVQRWRESDLWVLPAGPIPPNPSELLGSAAMNRLFARLTQAHDVIVFDSPPLDPVVDAAILGRLAGSTLVVVGVDRARKRHVAAALTALSRAEAGIAGVALNKVPAERAAGYGYGYGQAAQSTRGRGHRPSKHAPAPAGMTERRRRRDGSTSSTGLESAARKPGATGAESQTGPLTPEWFPTRRT